MKKSMLNLCGSFLVLGVSFCPGVAVKAQSTPETSTTGLVTPFQVCQTLSSSGKLEAVLTYDSTILPNNNSSGDAYVRLIPGTLNNYFTPGDFDLGQTDVFYTGTDQDLFSISFDIASASSITWHLSQNPNVPALEQGYGGVDYKLVIQPGSAPPCNPTYFQPTSTLFYSTAGTYTHQLLGQMAFVSSNGPGTTNVYPLTGGSGFSFANLTWTTTPPLVGADGGPSLNAPMQSLYGDVIVATGPAVSTSLLVQILDAGGRQVALGTDNLQFSGTTTDTTGCPTDVTKSVQGSMSAPTQLFGTQIWTQTVTIKNISGAAITGPIQLALLNLSGNARLFTSTGTGTCPGITGAPYITMTNGIAANANGAVVLTFTNSTVPSAAITYTPVIVAGGSRL